MHPSTGAHSNALSGIRVLQSAHILKLPNAGTALILQTKVAAYLLSVTHDAGRTKAAFFRKHGFVADDWELLAQALRRHAIENEVSRTNETEFGTRYIVDGPLHAPDGAALNVRSVWYISWGAERPRFVTTHPLKRKRP